MAAGWQIDVKVDNTSAADGRQWNSFDNSGFVVNQGSGIPGWVIAALAVGALWWMVKKHGR